MTKPPDNPTVWTERDEVARLLPELVEVDLPDDRRHQLKEFLMSEVQQDRRTPAPAGRMAPRRRALLATAALAAAAVGVLAVGNGVLDNTRPQHGNAATRPPASTGDRAASPAFELAAQYAETRPYTPPRADQWLYIRTDFTATGSVEKDKGMRPARTDQTWKSVDGTKMAGFNPENGKFETWSQNNGYTDAAALPTDPHKLLDVVRGQLAPKAGDSKAPVPAAPSQDEADGQLFSHLSMILEENVLSPQVTAALWRAIALVPGATQEPGTITVNGRKVVAVGRVQEGWRGEQLLLDAGSHEFVGYRSVAVADHTFQSPTGPLQIRKGEVQFTITRVTAKFVEKAGDVG